MNILFITQLFPEKKEGCCTSGALREFIEEWSQMGHYVQVIRPHFNYETDKFPENPEFNIGEKINVKFIKPIRIPVLKQSFYSYNKIINGLKRKPDVIICHLYNSYFAFSGLAKRLKIPLIIGIHMSDMKIAKTPLYRAFQKRTFNKAVRFACRSQAYMDIFNRYFPKQKDQSFLAMSGIPDHFLNVERKRNFGETKKHIITVSSLIKRKQIDFVIRSLAKLEDNDWHFSIVGSGPEKQNLIALAEKHDISDRISFIGQLPRHEIVSHLLESDIFILPSYDETFGLVYLEAMACGNLTIGSHNEGIDGIIIDSKNGYLCDATSEEDIFRTLRKSLLLSNKDFRQISEAGRKTAEKFTIHNLAGSYINEIKKTINDYH